MTDEKRPLKVFLCHAHGDQAAVSALYKRLVKDGVDAWLDKEKLLGGANWEYEIRKAVRESDVVVVCLSKQFAEGGFRQKEVQIALDEAALKPKEEIFIIPVRLEECDVPEQLVIWHWVDLFRRGGYFRLMKSLNSRALKLQRAAVELPKPDETNPNLAEALKPEQTKNIFVNVDGNIQGNIIIGHENEVKTSAVQPTLEKLAETRQPVINKLTLQQVDNIVQNNLFTIKGCEFERQSQGGNILYAIFINTESAKLSLGTYRVWEWHDGSGRSGWLSPDSGDPEIERLRKVILDMMIIDSMRANESIPTQANIGTGNPVHQKAAQRLPKGAKSTKKLTILLPTKAIESHMTAALSPLYESNFYVIQQPYEGERRNVVYVSPAAGFATPGVPQPVIPATPIGIYVVLPVQDNSAIVFLPFSSATAGRLDEFYELVKQYFQDLNLLKEIPTERVESQHMQDAGQAEKPQGKNPLGSMLPLIKTATESARMAENLMHDNPYFRPTPDIDLPDVTVPGLEHLANEAETERLGQAEKPQKVMMAKPKKKLVVTRLKTEHIIAIISATATIIAALIGSPLIGKWLAPVPTATATATMTLTQAPIDTFIALTPTETLVPSLTPTKTSILTAIPVTLSTIVPSFPLGQWTFWEEPDCGKGLSNTRMEYYTVQIKEDGSFARNGLITYIQTGGSSITKDFQTSQGTWVLEDNTITLIYYSAGDSYYGNSQSSSKYIGTFDGKLNIKHGTFSYSYRSDRYPTYYGSNRNGCWSAVYSKK